GTKTFISYEVSIGVNIRLKDIKRVNEFFTELLKSGVSEVDSVSFESSKQIEYVKEARILAMKAAHEKASAMAGAIGQTIGKAISIAEGTGDTYRIGPLNANNSISFSPGVVS